MKKRLDLLKRRKNSFFYFPKNFVQNDSAILLRYLVHSNQWAQSKYTQTSLVTCIFRNLAIKQIRYKKDVLGWIWSSNSFKVSFKLNPKPIFLSSHVWRSYKIKKISDPVKKFSNWKNVAILKIFLNKILRFIFSWSLNSSLT